MFSVVIPLYNKQDTIRDTLESVRKQTFEEFEVVVIDDGSTDGSPEIVQDFVVSDARFRVFRQENAHVSAARNHGVRRSCGHLVAFLDADDFWKPDHLENLKTLYQSYPEAGMYGTAYTRHYTSGGAVAMVVAQFEGAHGLIGDYFKLAQECQFVYTSSIAVPKRVLDGIDGFSENEKSGGEDLDVWMRVAIHHKVAYFGQSTVVYNCGVPNQLTQKTSESRRVGVLYLKNLAEAYAANRFVGDQARSVKRYLDHHCFKLIGFQFRRTMSLSEIKSFLERSGYDRLEPSPAIRMVLRLPYARIWSFVFLVRRCLHSRQLIKLFGGAIRRNGMLYTLNIS